MRIFRCPFISRTKWILYYYIVLCHYVVVDVPFTGIAEKINSSLYNFQFVKYPIKFNIFFALNCSQKP